MSTFTDLEKDAASVDGFVNENGLIPTRRNGPKPSWQYLVDQLTNDANYVLGSIEENALSRSKVSTPVTLSQGQTEITITGFNASLSAYYVKDVNSDSPRYRLFSGANEDYTFADETTSTITLNQTYDAGTKVYAVSLDPTGTGIVKAESQFDSTIDLKLSDIAEGAIATIPSLGSAKYLIKTGVDAEIGDIEFTDTRVAVLQPLDDGSWNVLSFGAFDDVEDSGTVQSEFFELAAKRADGGYVAVPKGTYRIADSTTTPAIYKIEQGVSFVGVPTLPPTGQRDLSNLVGEVEFTLAIAGFGQKYYGDGGFAIQKRTGRAQTTSAVTGASTTGQSGIGGFSHTSAKSSSDSGCFGGKFVALNDNTEVTTGVWGSYVEVIREAGAGNALGIEVAAVNKGATATFTPDTLVSSINGDFTASYWGSAGIAEADDTDVSIAMGFIGQPAGSAGGAKYERGIVFQQGATRSGESLCLPAQEQISWYDTRAGGNGKLSFISGANTSSQRGAVLIGTRNLSSQDFETYRFTQLALSYSVNNDVDLGESSLRFKSIYLSNSPDVSSDENLKEKRDETGDFSEAEMNAACKIASLPKMFKWLTEIEEKEIDGEEAYLHCSPMAQKVWEALESEGLNPESYGFISQGTDGAGWSLQPQEILWMVCAAQQKEINNIKSRLDALEA